jgi:hypothetical protein
VSATLPGLCAAAALLAACSRGPAIDLPGGSAGIGFDDLRWSARLGRVLAPAARTGQLDLVDPAGDHVVTSVGGFSSSDRYDGGHDFGVTSVDDTGAWLLATDRTTGTLDVVDVATSAIVGTVALAGHPDYVRWVAATQEAWVTEPGREAIEVFRLAPGAAPDQPPTPESVATIVVRGGPESLVIDARRGRAYTHLWGGASVSIDLASRTILATWSNGCTDSRGIALDEARGFLFAACQEGHTIAVDVESGRRLGEVWAADGLDVIDYDPALHHLYVAGQFDATLAILGVSSTGELAVLGTSSTTVGAHCVVSAGGGRLFVCDPEGGALLVREDPYAAIER